MWDIIYSGYQLDHLENQIGSSQSNVLRNNAPTGRGTSQFPSKE